MLLALLQVQVHQDPHESVVGVWTQAMVVKAPSRYVERYAKGLGCFGLLVVKITWLRCPYDPCRSHSLSPSIRHRYLQTTGNMELEIFLYNNSIKLEKKKKNPKKNDAGG